MPAFVDQTQEVNGLTLNLVVDEEWERLRPAAGKTVWANVVTAAPADDFTCLPRDALVEVARQPLGDFMILALLANQVVAELPAEDRLHCGRPKTSSNVRPGSLPETKSSSR